MKMLLPRRKKVSSRAGGIDYERKKWIIKEPIPMKGKRE